jgi:membrane protease YdiL (CAAX protease family)
MPSVESRSSIINAARNKPTAVSWVAKLKSRDFAEVAVGYGLVLIAVWTPDPMQRYLFWITLVWVLVATVISRLDARTLGLRPSEAPRSLCVAGVAAIAAVIAVWLAWELHTLNPLWRNIPVGTRLWEYLLWAFLQQFMLQDYFLLRLLRLLPSKTGAVLVAAVLFASAHVPNPLLVVVTLFWGAAACTLFLRYRDLYSLGLAHAIVGMCLAITVPNAVHHHMRVGLGYLRYRAHPQPVHRSQMDQIVSTEAWVMAEATSRRSSRQALP